MVQLEEAMMPEDILYVLEKFLAMNGLPEGSVKLLTPLLAGRVLELRPEGHSWRLSVTQVDGQYRRQVGGFTLSATAVVERVSTEQGNLNPGAFLDADATPW